MSTQITVGVTERHGISVEARMHPPLGVRYIDVSSRHSFHETVFTSHAEGNLHFFDGGGCDLLEAPLFPIHTNAPWIYTPAGLATAAAFGLFGMPLPRRLRTVYLRRLMLRSNFKALVFKSHAGMRTLANYAGITDRRILAKSSVVYPAIRKMELDRSQKSKSITVFLASGDFYRKGVAHTVDAFEALQRERDDVCLRICSSEEDFASGPEWLSNRYRERVHRNDAITIGAVSREAMLTDVFPSVDVFVSPTMTESFGFALVEASAFGVPSITTRTHAIPEIVEDGRSGFLVPIEQFNFIRKRRFYDIRDLDDEYHATVTRFTLSKMRMLAADPDLRERMGLHALMIARDRFSFERRNRALGEIYRTALTDV